MESRICTIERHDTKLQRDRDSALNPEAAFLEAGRCLGNQSCGGCGVCALFCPDECISIQKGGGIVIDYGRCKGCGICAAICPKGAIEMVVEEIEQ